MKPPRAQPPETATASGEPSGPRDWLVLLRQAVTRETIAGVAERVGLSRATLSLVLAGKYPAKSLDGVERKVRAALDAWRCPHFNLDLSAAECRSYYDRPLPRSSVRDIRHWRACQRCHHNPNPLTGEP